MYKRKNLAEQYEHCSGPSAVVGDFFAHVPRHLGLSFRI